MGIGACLSFVKRGKEPSYAQNPGGFFNLKKFFLCASLNPMAKMTQQKPAYLTYHHPDGREEQFKINFGNWDFINEHSISISANLTKLSRMTRLSSEYFTPAPKKEETVSNTYHLNDDKNAAIGNAIVAVENVEKALLDRQILVAEFTRKQDLFVAAEIDKLDRKLVEALQADVTTEELEEHIPHHGGVLADRIEKVIEATSLDNIPALV